MDYGERSYIRRMRDRSPCTSIFDDDPMSAAAASSSQTLHAEIKELEEGLMEASQKMYREARHEDAAVFLGATKAGKSTLVNFAIGNELIGEQAEEFLPVAVRMAGRRNAGPAIGAASNSETVVPTRWGKADRLPGLVIWDAPGFGDNRSPIQDIINAFYIFKLFQCLRSLRIVLVVDLNDIVANRISPFIELLECVEKLLRTQMRRCFSSIVVVFNKAPKEINNRPLNVSIIGNILKHKILDDSKLAVSPMGRELVQYLVDNNDQIGLFGLVSQPGPIGEDLDRGASTAILAARSIDAHSLREVIFPSLAEPSITFLNRAREKLSSDSAFQKLVHWTERSIQETEYYFREKEQVHGKCRHFKKERIYLILDLKEMLDPEIDSLRKLSMLAKCFPDLELKIEEAGLTEKSRLLSVVDYILEGRRVPTQRAFDVSLNTLLENLGRRVEMQLRASGNFSRRTLEKARRRQLECWTQSSSSDSD